MADNYGGGERWPYLKGSIHEDLSLEFLWKSCLHHAPLMNMNFMQLHADGTKYVLYAHTHTHTPEFNIDVTRGSLFED